MAENKTQPTEVNVDRYLAGVAPPERQADARTLITVMQRVSGEPPRMWGPSIIGFGVHRYRYDSGRTGETPRIAFAPRKAELVLYVGATTPNIAALLPTLGKHRTGKDCVYVKRLSDVDAAALEALVRQAWTNYAD